jgi:hypothetical protein
MRDERGAGDAGDAGDVGGRWRRAGCGMTETEEFHGVGMGVTEYQELSEEELFWRLGESLLGSSPGFGFGPREDGDDQERFGREWFARQHGRLQRVVCGHPRVVPFLGTTGSDRVIDVLTLAEVLRGADIGPVDVVLVAVLVLRTGLGVLCDGDGDDEDGAGASM